MKTLLFFSCAAVMTVAACDLPELIQMPDAVMRGDGGGSMNDLSAVAPGDLSAAAPGDLSGSLSADLGAPPIDDGIPAGAKAGSCDPGNWIAAASDSHPTNPPRYAIDGLPPTRWSTGAPQSVGQYLQIDFGGYVTVDQVAFDHSYLKDGFDDYPRGFDVLASNDGADFSRVLKSANFNADPGRITVSFAPQTVRYLRLSLNQATGSWFTVHELTVGCTTRADGGVGDGVVPDAGAVTGADGGAPMGMMNPNRANWRATASSTNGNDPVTNAFDGNPATRWADGKTPQYGDEWYRLDLGQSFSVREVWLSAAGGDFPSAVEVSLSSDDVTYTPVARGLGTDDTRITFPRQAARYVRINQIGSGYDHWWSVNELTIIQ